MKYQQILTLLAIAKLVNSQEETREEDFANRNAGLLEESDIQTKSVPAPIIPQGATENNEMGFWLDATYSTILDQYQELKLELDLTLHHNGRIQEVDWVYLFWLQAIDELKSTEEEQRLEGFVCAMRYKESFPVEGSKILPTSNELYRMGYIGTTPLQYETG